MKRLFTAAVPASIILAAIWIALWRRAEPEEPPWGCTHENWDWINCEPCPDCGEVFG